ncbi:hypothetical protein Aca07nite_25680 [Actinoplanes capillaceus]|uniref:Uncharacterized protein n=1 Tax=Actinoplanes campanulatus TaxID=113559 RepID=A0ABQ3WFN2_9ACTN|nr:hypothetical protein [Actinoplanes capillaceus]GID45293.1 hypothetical protein Aca07nite_25680 [Actinoplanes capillaceus]
MNKMTRALAMTGVAAAAGLAISAGPAVASPAGPTAVEAKPRAAATQQQGFKTRERIHGFYRSPRTCHRIGKAGVWQERWERYTCFRVYRGIHRGEWALKVSYGFGFNDRDRNRDWNDGPNNNRWNDGPNNNRWNDGPNDNQWNGGLNDRDQGPRGPWKKN